MDYFGPNGPLARRLGDAYRARPEQQRLVDAIIRLDYHEKLYAFGPVATGKNDALGVAALLSGHKSVLSTYTRTLLDSLSEASQQWAEDFPEKAIVILRGRANYVCMAKLADMRNELDHVTPAVRKRRLRVIEYGESHELVAGPDAPPGARELSQTACPGASKCKLSDSCHYYTIRASCASADLVVCTHAMVRSNCDYPTVTDRGPQYWLPRALWIADEGDKLLEACVEDSEISGRTIAAMMVESQLSAATRSKVQKLVDYAHRVCTGRYGSEVIDPRVWKDWASAALPSIQADIASYVVPLGDADMPAALSGLYRLERFLESMTSDRVTRGYAIDVRTARGRNIDEDERQYLGVTLRSRPITVGHAILDQVNVFDRFVAISGSMALPVADGMSFDFAEFIMRVNHTSELTLQSPIDYDRNLRVVHEPPPRLVGIDRDEQRNRERQHFTDLAIRLHREAGNTIILCTSYRTVNAVTTAFREAGLSTELLAQGEDSADTVDALAKQLRAGKRASIAAVTSGWVGLDLDSRYKACVLIERVPLPAVTQDLCLHGRILRDGEASAYRHYGVPIALRQAVQGAGRTLRRESDRCLLVLCDRRFHDPDYQAAIPGGQVVSLDAGIAWIRAELGAPAETRPYSDVALDPVDWSDLLMDGGAA